MLRHSTSFVRSRWKASMSSMQISRFSCHSSLRKLHRTCFLGVYYIYKTWPLQLKVQYKTSLMGSTFYLFIVNYLILVVHSRFYSFMGLFIIWKAISSHQIKKNDNWTKKNKQKRRKWPEMAFCPSQRDCSIRVCCSLRSHFGIGVLLVQVQIYFYRRSMTIFLTCHIQYLPLHTCNWV